MFLVTTPNTVYARGRFTTFGWEFRSRFAGVNVETSLADRWNPTLSETARRMFVAPDASYVGGDFTTVGGVTYGYLAVFSMAP